MKLGITGIVLIAGATAVASALNLRYEAVQIENAKPAQVQERYQKSAPAPANAEEPEVYCEKRAPAYSP
jgi:hypothetical protein